MSVPPPPDRPTTFRVLSHTKIGVLGVGDRQGLVWASAELVDNASATAIKRRLAMVDTHECLTVIPIAIASSVHHELIRINNKNAFAIGADEARHRL
jgi:hypothetical protein